ncbi:MAG: NADH-quinone oxidoreductase subunit L [Bacteroidetes bacterium]|nr:NADH-quinone oxidoreductase subunit L [Bacteroidota bacterium]
MTETLFLQFATAILFIPLISFLVLIFFGKKLSDKSAIVGSGLIGSTLLLSLIIFFSKINYFHNQTFEYTFTWVDFGYYDSKINLGIMIDNMTAIMLVVVTLVSFLVHLFSISYMKGDIRYSRYFAFLGIFSFSMLGIVLADNFFMIYVFWELVGLSSYLLIGHWYEKTSAANASKKAFIVNRVGDVGMFTGIMILWSTFGTLDFEKIFSLMSLGVIPFESTVWLTAAGLLIFCGAVGKSAQFPLHVWLPDAMEGPTPVSALIHAATMVAAGVYLIARVFPIFTADALIVIAYIGAITAFVSATIAIAQYDIKKVLAYSTVSQLGYMVMSLGVGGFTSGFFHLVTHAAFKAGLFLGSGSVIFAMHHVLHHHNDHHTDPQDIRNMGGLKNKMPITFWTFLIFTLAISGVPLTSGFLSKDDILAGTLAFSDLTGHTIIPIIAFTVAGMTAFYMFRVLILTFMGSHADSHRIDGIHESPWQMTTPLIIFAALSLFFFYSPNPTNASEGWFYSAVVRPETAVPENVSASSIESFEEAVHHNHGKAITLSLLIAGLGILISFATYYWKKISADKILNMFPKTFKFLNMKWYFDELYDKTVVWFTMTTAKVLAWFDFKIIDGLVNGTASVTKSTAFGSGKFDNVVVDGIVNLTAYTFGFFGLIIRTIQTGKVQTYLAFAIVGALMIFFFFN